MSWNEEIQMSYQNEEGWRPIWQNFDEDVNVTDWFKMYCNLWGGQAILCVYVCVYVCVQQVDGFRTYSIVIPQLIYMSDSHSFYKSITSWTELKMLQRIMVNSLTLSPSKSRRTSNDYWGPATICNRGIYISLLFNKRELLLKKCFWRI